MTHAQQKDEIGLPENFQEPEVNEELALEHGLSPEEYQTLLNVVGRTPSFTELGIFSVMWSEHCSYKSSRLHLKKLPTQAPWVIQGPGENAGVIDIGDNEAAIFKMESHNHPSFIEPYQGAATGVGGIMRDIFTMGGRPIANLNALRFGSPDHPKTSHLLSGVVAGIAGYGNCMGVPTVGGELNFHASYNTNILVNAMTVGLADQNKIFYARGAEIDQPVVYVGAKTGRDGIHGATMASGSFDDEAEQKRPTVQVGDPFTEKLLMEACLELMQEDAIISIQDMGAAGLTSSSVEIAQKGNIGITLDLDQVPQREAAMTPYEIMLSESQERMLMILKPGREDIARAIFDKWDLDFAIIGHTTKRQNLVLNMYGKNWCDIPVPPLVDESPIYDRPTTAPPAPDNIQPEKLKKELEATAKNNLAEHLAISLKRLVSSADLCSRKWVWEQYDSLVGGESVTSPGIRDTQSGGQSDAAIVKIPGRDKALAMTSDCTPRYCYANPFEGGQQAVCESYRNICASGARPLAVTNNLNFGNPERPEIMAQFVKCIEGMAAACRELDYPVISGNVSLYNETNNKGIHPTPVIGGVGVIDNWQKALTLDLKAPGQTLFLVGSKPNQTGEHHLGQSLYLRIIHGLEAGTSPVCNVTAEKKTGEFILEAAANDFISTCHDVSDGGVLIALAEMAMAASNIGVNIHPGLNFKDTQDAIGFWFGEDQGRYLLATDQVDEIISLADRLDIGMIELGQTNQDGQISIPANLSGQNDPTIIKIDDLITAHEAWFPDYFSGDA